MTDEVLVEDHGRVRLMTLNRPEKLNALSPEGRELHSRLLQQFAADDDVWALVITGAGRAFSTGLDMSRASEILTHPSPTLTGANALEIWKPIIAAVHGYAAGGGCELALACDIRIAAPDARFGLTEVRRGLIPGAGGIQRLVRHLAFGDALRMLFTGEWVDAQEALRIGLVQEIAPEGALVERALELAQQICANGPIAVRTVKEAAYRGADLPLRAALVQDQLFSLRNRQSNDAKEGVAAFVEKRAPRFTAT